MLNIFLLQIFLILYIPKQIYAFGEKKKVKLEQVEVQEYPRPAPLFIKIIYTVDSQDARQIHWTMKYRSLI